MTDDKSGFTDKLLNSNLNLALAFVFMIGIGAVGGTAGVVGPNNLACAVQNDVGVNIPTVDCSTTTQIDAQEQFAVNQHVTVEQYRDLDNDGEREKVATLADREKNLLVDQGKNFYQAKIAGTSFPGGSDLFSNATYIALSNESSPEAADVGLQGEFTTGGMARKDCRTEGTYIDQGIGNYSCAATFTATSTFNNVNMTGLMWNGTQSSNSLVAEVSFKSANILPDDQIVANWTEISFTEAP